jgi:peptidoglycan/xylan/chitin deacetylase (PgdA/CDA1 family)
MKPTAMAKSVFILSLDLELLWGLMNTRSYRAIRLLKKAGGVRLRERIDSLLSVLEKYQIPATWAVVGHLLADPYKECKLLSRCDLHHANSNPTFKCKNAHYNDLLFGRDILDKILSSSVNHEIGYHSFSHAIFSQISKEVADSEIKAGIEIAKQFGISFKSFVFPQNKIGHTDVIKKYGFLIYRGKTLMHNNLRSHALNKVNGLINEIIAPPAIPEWKNGIWEIPSSMYFTDPKYPFSLLPRAKLGLWRAMRSNMVFHVWMHPWNLLEYKSLFKDFERFVEYVCKKRSEGKIKVMTMGDFAASLNKTYVKTGA